MPTICIRNINMDILEMAEYLFVFAISSSGMFLAKYNFFSPLQLALLNTTGEYLLLKTLV